MRLLPAAALLLAACAGTPAAPPPPPPDETLGRAARAGRLALELERPTDSARLYGVALARARERDDPAAIADSGLGLAAAELARGQPAAALRITREVKAELARRDAPAPSALTLAEALALYRLGDPAAAAAAEVTARPAEDADAASRAWFLRGLIAAGIGNAAVLAEARAALGAPTTPGFRADASELAALAALAAGDAAAARTLAAAAAQDRRDSLDYRGLGRALALEADAARRQGDTATAADLLLRAGRSAAARGEVREARRWLTSAESLAREARTPVVANAARAALRAMEENGG